jgi:protein TonB
MVRRVACLAAVAVLVGSCAAVFANQPRRFRVGGDVKQPIKLTHVNPAYPEEAKSQKAAGTVILEAVITTDGSIAAVEVLRGVHVLLDEAAVTAVRQWKYRPTVFQGESVELLITVTVAFTVPDERQRVSGRWPGASRH